MIRMRGKRHFFYFSTLLVFIFEDLKRSPNTKIGTNDFFETASGYCSRFYALLCYRDLTNLFILTEVQVIERPNRFYGISRRKEVKFALDKFRKFRRHHTEYKKRILIQSFIVSFLKHLFCCKHAVKSGRETGINGHLNDHLNDFLTSTADI